MSENFIPDPSGRVATFTELARSSTESAQLVSTDDSNRRPEPVAPNAVLDQRLSYALTDGSNYLWLYFNQDGVLTSADRFGFGGNVDELLIAVADTMVSEHDGRYWDLIGIGKEDFDDQGNDLTAGPPTGPVREDDSALPVPAAVRLATTRKPRAMPRKPGRPARLLRAESLVRRLLMRPGSGR